MNDKKLQQLINKKMRKKVYKIKIGQTSSFIKRIVLKYSWR